MQLRHKGLTYSDIAESGGGIQKTVDFTRSASIESLTKLGQRRIELEPLNLEPQPWNAKVVMD